MPAANQHVKQRNRTERPKKVLGRCPECGAALVIKQCIGCSIETAELGRKLARSIPRGEIISMIENERKEGPTE